MSLTDWFRRHGNVFSISTKEIDVESGDEDMLVEDYGERAVEAERVPGYGRFRSGPGANGTVVRLDVSDDELAGEPLPDSAP
jgi:hypothetical protein